ncbi:hypothetical protein [Rhizobium mongolense]|uniref:hypothetical protein n=1 Tax=Rhizobium mongolense TaxID=57676 RepID=UPI000B82E6B1|nr:hypothetical protein [Rhizobium mongolense]
MKNINDWLADKQALFENCSAGFKQVADMLRDQVLPEEYSIQNPRGDMRGEIDAQLKERQNAGI